MKLKKIDINAFISSKKEKIKKNKKLAIIVTIGVIGMILILLSEIFQSADDNTSKIDEVEEHYSLSSTYKDKIQSELLSIVKKNRRCRRSRYTCYG